MEQREGFLWQKESNRSSIGGSLGKAEMARETGNSREREEGKGERGTAKGEKTQKEKQKK